MTTVPQDLKTTDRGNTVPFAQLSRAQVDVLSAARAAHGDVRWTGVRILTGQVEMTMHFIDGECRQHMRADPGSTYARRVLVAEDGSIIHKEVVSF